MTAPAEPTKYFAAEEIPSAPLLYDLSVKRHELLQAIYDESNRRAAILLGFSSVLATGAALVISRAQQAGVPTWGLLGATVVLGGLYVGLALSCYRTFRPADTRVLFDPRQVFEQLAGEPVECAKASLMVTVIEPRNEGLIVQINAKAQNLRRATALCVSLAILLFIGGMVPPLFQRRSDMPKDPVSSTENPPARPRPPRPAGAPAPAEPRTTAVTFNRIKPVTFEDDQIAQRSSGDFAVVHIQTVWAPATELEAVRALDPALQRSPNALLERWLTGPVLRHCRGLRSVKLTADVSNACAVRGSYEIRLTGTAQMEDGSTRR